MNTESIFFVCCAIVISTLILTMGFSKCDMNGSPALQKYKICMDAMKDSSKCEDPFKVQK